MDRNGEEDVERGKELRREERMAGDGYGERVIKKKGGEIKDGMKRERGRGEGRLRERGSEGNVGQKGRERGRWGRGKVEERGGGGELR